MLGYISRYIFCCFFVSYDKYFLQFFFCSLLELGPFQITNLFQLSNKKQVLSFFVLLMECAGSIKDDKHQVLVIKRSGAISQVPSHISVSYQIF